MADYRLGPDGVVIRVADGATIPPDPDNFDRAFYDKWIEAGNVPDPYMAPPEPVPSFIADYQFFGQLKLLDIITEDQAMASNAGVIPPPLLAIIDQMPKDQRFVVKMRIGGATTFYRDHPLTKAIGASYGWTEDQIDDFFHAAAQL